MEQILFVVSIGKIIFYKEGVFYMSKERKIINQRIEINNDITISDLVTAIPAGLSGPIFINGDLIILEEDVLNFGYSDMWLFNEVHILGNLKLIDLTTEILIKSFSVVFIFNIFI